MKVLNQMVPSIFGEKSDGTVARSKSGQLEILWIGGSFGEKDFHDPISFYRIHYAFVRKMTIRI